MTSERGGDAPPLVVLHSVQRWLPQTETWLYTQVRSLPRDIENHIACEHTANLDQFPHPHIHCLTDQPARRHVWDRGVRRLGFRHHLGFLDATARATRARLLHSHFGFVGWRDMAVAQRRRLVHVVTFYGADVLYYPTIDPRWRSRYREMFARVDAVLCEGPHMGRTIVDLGCPESKIRVHHLGVDLSLIRYEPRAWRRGETLRVLMSGSFREKKGFPFALEALARIQQDALLEITIIGDEHGEARTVREKQKMVDVIARTGLQPRTRLLGYQPYSVVMEEARRAHVFLSPSVTAGDGDTEGGAPVSLIEMAASGMLLISTTHCDIPGVVIDGSTGWLAPERDVDALVRHLRRAIENPSSWRAMQDAGRAHIEAEFDAARQGQRLAGIYRELTGPDRPGGGHA